MCHKKIIAFNKFLTEINLLHFQLHEEKIAAIQEKLELSDQKLAQYSKLPEMEEELKARMEALTQVGSQVGRVFWMLTNREKNIGLLLHVYRKYCYYQNSNCIKLINYILQIDYLSIYSKIYISHTYTRDN